MDVSNQVLNQVRLYGGSDNTSPGQLSSSKSLNYANGPSINNPVVELVKGIPFTIRLKGDLGLNGVENLYVKVNMDVDSLSACLLYTSPSPRDGLLSRMPSSA